MHALSTDEERYCFSKLEMLEYDVDLCYKIANVEGIDTYDCIPMGPQTRDGCLFFTIMAARAGSCVVETAEKC
jgi:hypothetical protein